ncbi:hypothetical protein CPC16_001069 [Podila verticillata]|nr:hypothetical protein CPC16_001069 [Podila verticillata]KAI9240072.1 MAG: hypothetical protein BYD32DRAFT_409459 [Podila humilis]
MHTLFTLPELLAQVAEYLTGEEATRPSRVSRAFHQAFGPIVWRACAIGLQGQKPSPQGLITNAHSIRRLAYDDAFSFDYLSLPCNMLTSLMIARVAGSDSDTKWHHLAKLVKQNRHLHTLQISDRCRSATLEFWSSLASCTSLRTVDIQSAHMDQEQFAALWNGCKSMQSLKCHHIRVHSTTTTQQYPLEPHPTLQKLSFANFANVQLLKLCSNLQAISWYNNEFDCDILLEELATLLQGGQLKQLDSISMSHTKDQDLSRCLKAMRQIKKISSHNGDVGPLSFHAMSRHFGMLEHLYIPSDSTLPSEMILNILESCPQLTYLQATKVAATQVMKAKSWAALNLKALHLGITIDSDDQEVISLQSRSVFERLSKLTHLTQLTIHGPYVIGNEDEQGLDLRLESGLDKLAAIKGLKYLDFDHTVQNMSGADVAWMAENWKDLGDVFGTCNSEGEFYEQPVFYEDD